MKNLTFSKVSKSLTTLALLAVFGLAGCGSGGGGGGNAGTTETTSPPKTYILTVDKFGEGAVTSDVSGINCGDDCSETHNEGTTVVLTAASSGTNGYQFSSWAGCDSVSGNTCTVVMDKDKMVLPTFIRTLVMYATTKILDDATLQYLIKQEGTTYYFDSQATMVSDLNPGDIIAGSTGMGFLRKVSAVYTSQEGLIVLETTDATLEEAIQEGSIAFTKELTHADLMSSKMQEGISFRKASPVDRESNKVFTFDFDNLVYDQSANQLRKATPFEWTSDANVKISGSVSLAFTPDFGIDFGITGVKEFKTILLATQTNELKITAEGKATVSSGKIKVGTLKFYKILLYTPAGIPFSWVTPEFNIYVGLDGSVDGELSTEASLTNYITAGIRYTNDNGWEPKSSYSRKFNWQQPTLTSSGSIEAYVQPEGVLWIDGAIGPYINLKGYLGLDANATTNLSSFELFWRLYCGIDSEAGVKGEIIGFSLGDFGPVDLLDPNPEWELASGGIYSLLVSKTGTGSGTVTSSLTGISCGTDCSKNYNSGTQVTLTPTASSGSTFAGWSGGGCSGIGSCTVTMDAAKTVTATFNSTTSTPPSVSSFSLNSGASSTTSRTVTLNNTATGSPTQYIASESSTFSGASWQTYSTAPSFTLSSGNATKTVYFKVKNSAGTESAVVSDSISLNEATTSQYTLAVSKSGTGSGTVISSPIGINCGTDCSESYNSGTSVILTPTATSGSIFAGWSGGGCSGTGTCSATMNAATTVTATFNQQSSTTPTVTGISPSTFTSSSLPYSAGITVYGTYLDQIASVKYSWTGATNGTANGSWASTGTTSRTLNPTVLSSGDTSGTSTWTVRFYDSSGSEIAGTSKTFTVTYSPTGGSQVERITNGSFSSGTSGWTLSGDFWAGTNLTRYYSSPGYASGGVDSTGAVKNYASGYIYQAVTIPSNATSATLSFWLNITSDETGSAYDYLFVEILNSGGALLTTPFTYSNVDKGSSCGATCTYSQKSYNLLSFKGQTIRIQFRATTDIALSTVFRIDDVSLMADGN